MLLEANGVGERRESPTTGSDTGGTLLEEYTYHPVEERVLIKNVSDTDGSWKETIYYVSDEFLMVENSSGRFNFTYIKHEGQLVAELRPGGAKIFHHPDHLGSTTLITDSGGSAVENTSYTPYGVILTGGNESRYQYEGKEYDSSIGQYDFHFRGYKAEWGIFTQPDTLIQNVYDPQSLNRYAFERGNPYKYTDESGHAFVTLTSLVMAAVFAVIAAYALMLGSAIIAPPAEKLFGYLKSYMEAKANANLASSATETLEDAYRMARDPSDENTMAFIKSFVGLAVGYAAGEIAGAKYGEDYNIGFGAVGDSVEIGVTGIVKSFFNALSSISSTITSIQHVSQNTNLNYATQNSIIGLMVNSAASGSDVTWYYNPNTGIYQPWYGEGRPGNPDMEPIDGGRSGGRSGGRAGRPSS